MTGDANARDTWADWLLRRRFGEGEGSRPDWMVELEAVRDRVLDRARLEAGERLLDVGAGDGLIAFGALERGAEVVFSDVSDDLLNHARELAEAMGLADRCRFVHASADDLAPFRDGEFNVVTTRSVLIYVEDKPGAFSEFFRVLRPGGRISLFEPINRFGSSFRTEDTFWGYDASGFEDLAARLNRVYAELQPDSDPMLDFDERDLVELVAAAGFVEVHLEYEADLQPAQPHAWETWVSAAGNPKIPSLAEAMGQVLTPGERERLTSHLRPLVEGGLGGERWAKAYLWAVRR